MLISSNLKTKKKGGQHPEIFSFELRALIVFLRSGFSFEIAYSSPRKKSTARCVIGLEFLQDTPEFQERYCDTVIVRIMYCLDRPPA